MTHSQTLFISKTTSFTSTVEIEIGGCSKVLRFNEISFDMYTQK